MKISNISQKNTKSKSRKKLLKPKDDLNSKEKFNTVDDFKMIKNKKRTNQKEKEKEKESYYNISKKKEILLKIKPEKNNKESYSYNIITKKINKSKEKRTYKEYPNLIQGVLDQATYNNQTNNTNYNEYIRYKPINDILFNEQSNIPTGKITTENNNSLNISFNSKSKEKEKNDIENNTYNNNYNIENDFKINTESFKSRKNDTLIKSEKSISPILSNNYNKKESNKDLVSEYIDNVEIRPKKTVNIIAKINIEKTENFNIINNKSNNLEFKTEEEMWKYIRKKMTEEKEKEYNDNKLKYNYFTLIKKFRGKILYEIGLENSINKINEILEKENVKVENELVLLITKKSYEKLNTLLNTDANYDNNNNEINMLKTKIDELKKVNEQLKNNLDIMKEENDKLNEKINILNDELKIYKDGNNTKDNMINNYQNELKELKELNRTWIEQKNEKKIYLEIIKNDFFDIINILPNNKTKEKNMIYLIEHFRHEYKYIPKKEEIKEIKVKENNNIIKPEKKEKKDIKINKETKEKEKGKEKENKMKTEKKEDKKENKKDISTPNNMKDKINIFNQKNTDTENDINKKEENIPNKIFLVSNSKKEETTEEKMKREERMNKALKRIKNKRKSDAEKEKVKKSENIKELSTALESQLQKGEGKKLFVDLEYEKE